LDPPPPQNKEISKEMEGEFGVYSKDIPSLGNLENESAENIFNESGIRADGIHTGTIRRRGDYFDAEFEERAMKKLKAIGTDAISDVELLNAKLRKRAILQELEMGTGNEDLGAEAPAWAQVLNQNIQRLQENIQDLGRTINAKIENLRIRKRNRVSIQWHEDSGEVGTLFPPRKTIAGSGQGIAEHAAPQLLPGAPFDIDSSPPIPPFPVNVQALFQMDQQTIDMLHGFYNEDFSIVPADDLNQQRVKFKIWLSR
jgi:hypothetical protein